MISEKYQKINNNIISDVILCVFFLIVFPSWTWANSVENRCGWWDNSTPGNVDFSDKDGNWTVSMQGGYLAKGNWSPSGEKESTNGNHGRYCVCLKAEFEKSSEKVVRIHSGKTKKLRDCLRDQLLPGYEKPATGALKEFIGLWVSMNEDCLPNRDFSIQPGHISMGGEASHNFKVVKEHPLWIELTDPGSPSDKFQRLSKITKRQIEMQGSNNITNEPNGVKCILAKKK
jgi:hypothetical protein